jgi:hypothetical protein
LAAAGIGANEGIRVNERQFMKPEQWHIRGEYITDNDGSERFRVMGSAPYNAAWMQRAVKTNNEYDALCAVEAAADNSLQWLMKADIDGAFAGCAMPNGGRKAIRRIQDALEFLAEVRKGI